MRKRHDWAAVQRCYDDGCAASQCRDHFTIKYGAWVVAIRRGKLRVEKSGYPRRYDWRAVQAYYGEGHSFFDCMRRFGFCRTAWHKAVKRGDMKPRPLAQSLQELLANGRGRRNIKQRLIRAGLLDNRCQDCGVSEWLGERLTIQIDHANGNRDDYRLENLRMLCPNCHSQTPTYGGRNARLRHLQESAPAV